MHTKQYRISRVIKPQVWQALEDGKEESAWVRKAVLKAIGVLHTLETEWLTHAPCATDMRCPESLRAYFKWMCADERADEGFTKLCRLATVSVRTEFEIFFQHPTLLQFALRFHAPAKTPLGWLGFGWSPGPESIWCRYWIEREGSFLLRQLYPS